ncbi:3-hydroxyisobutyryl-coenzyme A hydrolase isoform 1 [Pyrrhoderma noxium]|uniref:3-hydroxyisobutyryl-CoA hydrolase n=1 Tax=Pyrrhoderma noxium TaxID=2282107 RepID=A0A286UW56_9AGAM|nr:3-hydroxyisobutyryl-coenzyme A hydrolase isoform 1 [Pyrrhoderma noxium]
MLSRTALVAKHMSMSTSASEPPILFESSGSLRRYILNRPKKHNALDGDMIAELRPKLREWDQSELCKVIVGSGSGPSLCAGGDVVSVVKFAASKETQHLGVQYFKNEFELDYQLASLSKPYIAIMQGNTMGGGVGLSINAPFRIATETTTFAMPETKIGYCPDVGASHFLPKLDGELGTYFALTGEILKGRAVFELGIATHYVPSKRVPGLLEAISSIENPSYAQINSIIEEHYGEPLANEPGNTFVNELREAVDTAFGKDTVEDIISTLEELMQSKSEIVAKWAESTLSSLNMRSPTSLKVALEAIRRGKKLTLSQALGMEMGIANAFLTGASSDFATGVWHVVVDKRRDTRPNWSPSELSQVDKEFVKNFFDNSKYVTSAPKLEIDNSKVQQQDPMRYGLPTEEEIKQVVRGEHPQSGALALTREEVVKKFLGMTGNKHGVSEKVYEVLERRCEVIQDPDNNGCLRWKF